MSLSKKQIAAAHRIDQDVCVVAGPGSGKTSVLIERFSWLVKERGILPRRILAITFTEKAATEIKQRLAGAFANDFDVREKIERAYVSTIHAFCTRILRENAIAAGLDPLFEVADDAMSHPLRQEAADEVLEDLYGRDPRSMRGFLESLAVGTERDGHVPDLAQSLIDIYEAIRVAGAGMDLEAGGALNAATGLKRLQSILKEILAEPVALNTPKQHAEHARLAEWAREVIDLPSAVSKKHFRVLNEPKFNKGLLLKNSRARVSQGEILELTAQLRAEFLIDFYAPERKLIVEALREIDIRFRAKKTAQSLLDFADLEQRAIELLQSDSEICRQVRENFDYILMDELQDTNPLQWKLIDLIRRQGNFFAVGDINQSIFRFRHAEPELFRRYQDGITAAGQVIDVLRDNYRSRPALLDGVNLVFEGADSGIEKHVLTSARAFPDKVSPSIEIIGACGEETGEAETIEAEWVARRITELAGMLTIGEGDSERRATYADIAILTRTGAAMLPVQKALDRFGIPSIAVGGRTFFTAREVRDLIQLLRVIANPCDEVSLAGVLRSPLVGVSDECLLHLRQSGPIHAAFAALAFNGAGAEDREALLEFHRELAGMRSLRDAVSPDRLLRTAIDDSDYESTLTDRGKANVEKFLGLIRSQFKGSVAELLDHIDNSSAEAEAPPSDFGNAVRLMSIHKSKGLEFPIVFLPGLHKGTGGGLPVITWSPRCGLGVKWRDPDTRKGEGDAAYCEIEAEEDRRQTEENFRLLYVAMTRAKEHMVLSFVAAKKSRSDWWKFLCRQFGVNASAASNEAVVQNGVRVFLTDTAPELAGPVEVETQQSTALVIEKAEPDGQFDSSAPVTSVSLFAACPRKYYLSRYLKWEPRERVRLNADEDFPERDAGELDAGEFGVQVHHLLAGLTVPSPDPRAVALAERFHKSALGIAAAQATTVQREFDFLMEIEGIVLRGQIDLWFEHNGRITIVDYKTDQVRLPVEESRIESYALQLRIYALAIEKFTGKLPDSAWLYLLRPDEAVEVGLSPLMCAQARQSVAALRDAQDRLHFPLSEGAHCLRCEFFNGLCPAGSVRLEGAAISPLPSFFAELP